MNMSKFKRIDLTVKPQLLDKLLLEYLSGHAPSRLSAAEACNVSKVTSGKVADALISGGFMDVKIFSKGERRPSAHLLFSDKSSVLIIDLSGAVYKMCIVNPMGKILLTLSHAYDPEVSFEDNLNIFISRNGLKLKSSRLNFAAISVLYADAGRRGQLENMGRISYLPSILMRGYIEDVIFSILGRKVVSHLAVSEAIAEAVRFKAIDLDPLGRGISYIFIGSRVSSLHVYSNGSAVICAPQNMLTKAELTDIRNIRLIPKENADALFVKIADFMDSAFSPSILLLSSDILIPDRETGERICRKFTLTGRQAPIICTRDDSFPPEYLGASRAALLHIVKAHITSTSK